jgi:D-arginine dehydrogenase
VPRHPTTVIIGAGIAGLAAALHVPRTRRVIVVEGEPVTFAHSSGRNAAILRPLEASICISELVVRSTVLLAELGAPKSVLDGRGLVLAAPNASETFVALLNTARTMNLPHALLEGAALAAAAPSLRGGECSLGIQLPNAGVLDLAGLAHWLQARLHAANVELRTHSQVRAIRHNGTRACGVALDDGRQIDADEVVIAAGAFSEELGASCDCPLPLRPHRRHLVLYDTKPARAEPVAWNVESNVYFRQDGEATLACPGDETPHPAGVAEVDEQLVNDFPLQLAKFAPTLDTTRRLHARACLRTVTADGHPVVGRDPRLEGLFWAAGLAGVGMSAGLACGEQLGAALLGREPPAALAPSRYVATHSRGSTAVHEQGIA